MARQMYRVWRQALDVIGGWEVVTIMAAGPVDTEAATSTADHCLEANTHQQLAACQPSIDRLHNTTQCLDSW